MSIRDVMKLENTKLLEDQKITKNKAITVRAPIEIIEELEKITKESYQTLSNIVRIQLIKFVRWGNYEKHVDMMPIPKDVMNFLIKNKSDEELKELTLLMYDILKEWTILTKNDWKYNLCMESLVDYMYIAGIELSHKKILDVEIFEIKHGMDEKWIIFIQYLLKMIFKEFSKPDVEFKFSQGVLRIEIKLITKK